MAGITAQAVGNLRKEQCGMMDCKKPLPKQGAMKKKLLNF